MQTVSPPVMAFTVPADFNPDANNVTLGLDGTWAHLARPDLRPSFELVLVDADAGGAPIIAYGGPTLAQRPRNRNTAAVFDLSYDTIFAGADLVPGQRVAVYLRATSSYFPSLLISVRLDWAPSPPTLSPLPSAPAPPAPASPVPAVVRHSPGEKRGAKDGRGMAHDAGRLAREPGAVRCCMHAPPLPCWRLTMHPALTPLLPHPLRSAAASRGKCFAAAVHRREPRATSANP